MTRLGVDLGATWLRACLGDGRKALWTRKVPAVNWRAAPEVLRALLRREGLRRVGEIVLGGTRLGDEQDRAALTRALKPLCGRSRVLPDYEIAHLAAFAGTPGVLLVASTGSIAYARGAGRRAARAGGLGPLLGDEGSGFWLGREAARDARLRRALRLPDPLRLAHSEDPVRAVAGLAPRVLSAAGRDASARRLREEAASHLAALAREASRGAGLRAPIPLALHGSLFKDAGLRRAVLRRLGSPRPIAARTSAERAAAGL